MILAVDVDYRDHSAVAAGVLFKKWHDAKPVEEVVVTCEDAAGYVPGEFYRRELPCILKLLAQPDIDPECIVIDGYVTLGANAGPGLGMHLRNALDRDIAVIGVAKNAFRGTPASAELLRGKSKRPLYITAAGIDAAQAKALIRQMYGDGRIPELLKYVDHLSRTAT